MAKRLITKEYMADVSKGLSKVFNNALSSHNKDYEKIATTIRANSINVEYRWLADMPGLKEWVGDRELKELSMYDYSIRKKDWEASIKVHRDVIEYDDLGIIKPQILALAMNVGEHYNDLAFGLLEKNGNCYDGKKFFAKDHQINSVTFSNLGERELNKENFLATKAEMLRLYKENGAPLRIRPNTIIVPPELEGVANELFLADRLSNGSTNILYKSVEVIVCELLTNPKAWYLLDTSRPLKPLILQINQEARFSAQDNPDNEAAFMRKEFRYGIDTQDNAGYGFWQLAYANLPS